MSAFDRHIERIRRVPPIAADAAMAVAILTLDIIELTLFGDQDISHLSPWAIPLFAVACLALLARRTRVWLSYAVIQGVGVVALFARIPAGSLSVLILWTVLVFAVADGAPAWAAVLAVIAQVGLWWVGDLILAPDSHPSLLADAVYATPIYGLAAFAGWSQRRRRALTEQLEARAGDVRLERERLAAQAVVSERSRIAHELRALVLREVERMTGQAQKARSSLGARWAAAPDEIAAIETTGRRTLVEMRRLLLVLRRSEPQAPKRAGLDPPGVDAETRHWLDDVNDRTPPAVRRLQSWLSHRWVVDSGLVLLLAGFMAGEFIVYGPVAGKVFVGWLPVVLAAVILSVLLLRRRIPFSALCVISVAVFLWILVQGDSPGASEQSLLLATYTVAAYKKPGWAIAAVALALFSWSPYPAKYRCLCLLDIGTLAIFAAAAGVAMQGGRRLNRELEKLLDLLLRTREERARLAVAEERTRVAREMHDVVAHGLTVMVVQAGGARMVVESDPTLSQEMLGDVERMGLEAIRELESLVGTLDPGSHPREEEVSIEAPDVPALVARLRRSGQTIHLTQEGASVPLDQGLQISLYRIVQEALTNARKHAPGTRAIVAIRYLSQAVEVEITNGAAAGAATAGVPGAGQGLIGIRERASLLGGTAEAGPIQGGGFRVSASLPLELVPA